MNVPHTIRLGPAWTLHCRRDDVACRRIDLPGRWDRSEDPVRLERAFGRPTRGIEGMAVALRLERVPGLRGVWLNETPLNFETETSRDAPIPDGLLAARNRLELEVDRRGLDGAEDGPWGEIALVFTSEPGRATMGEPRPSPL